MSDREPVREYYDAVVDLGVDGDGCFGFAVIKLTYHMDEGGNCRPVKAEPLENDIRNDELDPRLPPHTDFWPDKEYADLAVVGTAHPPGGRPVPRMRVAVQIGERRKEVEVLGDRFLEWSDRGRPRVGAPEPFETMPLDHTRAYGGCDFRVPFSDDDPRAMGVTLDADHPGLYPRNPWGTGYVAVADPIQGIRLPNLEDPRHLLEDGNLIADPEAWHRQPMPWFLDWVPVNCFPRSLFLAVECEPWFSPPDDEQLTEVRWGLLPMNYRSALKDQTFGSPPHRRFRQEASHGMILPTPPYGEVLRLEGMHPDRPVMQSRVPVGPPSVSMRVEGDVAPVEPRLTSLCVYPDRELLTMVYVVRRRAPRPFIPGIHARIPITISVGGDHPIEYQTPETVRSRLAAADQENEP